jgi:predicted nucleotidyltransferase
MSRTALKLEPQEWRLYNPASAVKHRAVEERSELARRRREALKEAHRIARLLRNEYKAQKVVLFGSLARAGVFTRWSDIDLAAWGIPAERFYAAVAAATGCSAHFRVDLVDADDCRPALREAIEKEGREL